MRAYDFSKKYSTLLTPDIVALLTQIHEYKGEQALFIEAKADTLIKLVEIAKIQSTEASNKIEGIYTSDERLKKLVQDKTTPAPGTSRRSQVTGMYWLPSTRVLTTFLQNRRSSCNSTGICINSAARPTADTIKRWTM